MTGSAHFLNTYVPCLGSFKIKIDDDSLLIGTGKGSMPISQNLTLNSVFYVPNLSHNLLSINKLIHDLKYVIKFTFSSC